MAVKKPDGRAKPRGPRRAYTGRSKASSAPDVDTTGEPYDQKMHDQLMTDSPVKSGSAKEALVVTVVTGTQLLRYLSRRITLGTILAEQAKNMTSASSGIVRACRALRVDVPKEEEAPKF